jgi:uncharacterized membrane protein
LVQQTDFCLNVSGRGLNGDSTLPLLRLTVASDSPHHRNRKKQSVSLYVLVKFVHVLLAIVAVGFNASYGVWLARAPSDPTLSLHVLKGIKVLDDRFANPAYVLLFVTGLLMAFLAQIPLTAFWLGAALILYVVLVVLGLALYSPSLKRQIATLEAEGLDSPAYKSVAQRNTTVGIVLAVLALLIVFLMVTKPTL